MSVNLSESTDTAEAIGLRLAEAEETLGAIRQGELEALMRALGGRCRTSVIGPGSVPIEVSVSLTAMQGTQLGQLSLIVTDLSELLEANRGRARAEHDSRTKDEFLAMLGHELRTPL